MVRKVLKTGDLFAIPIDKKMLKQMHITEDTELKISIEGNRIIIETVKVSPKEIATDESNDDVEFRAVYKKVIKKYTPALKKLAKN